MCTIEDLKEMGIPLGPRKKIAKFVKERVNKQVSLSAEYLRGLQKLLWLWPHPPHGFMFTGCTSGSSGEQKRGQRGHSDCSTSTSSCNISSWSSLSSYCEEASSGQHRLLCPCGLQLLWSWNGAGKHICLSATMSCYSEAELADI